jgi:hypothetical protein
VPAFWRWCEARRIYGETHPDSDLADWLHQIGDETEMYDALIRWRPLEPVGAVRIHNFEVKQGVYDPISGNLRGKLRGEESIPAGGTGVRHCDWL